MLHGLKLPGSWFKVINSVNFDLRSIGLHQNELVSFWYFEASVLSQLKAVRKKRLRWFGRERRSKIEYSGRSVKEDGRPSSCWKKKFVAKISEGELRNALHDIFEIGSGSCDPKVSTGKGDSSSRSLSWPPPLLWVRTVVSLTQFSRSCVLSIRPHKDGGAKIPKLHF